ncbi:MAG: HAD family hydrolase [Dehalococcoidales bacterium]|nr:HAD family hydrolase [Dehalococcoidales bacterium]
MKYKAVIFDLFGTLVDNSPKQNWLKEMSLILFAPEEDFSHLWNATFKKRMTGEFYEFQDCIEYICRQLNLKVKKEQIERAINLSSERVRREITAIQPNAIETISQLKTDGYKIALLSNCSIAITRLWGETPFANIINATVFSCSVGMMKPDLRIFHLAAEKLQVNPTECLYIADGMDGELKAAATVGMTPARIRFPTADPDDPYSEDWQGTTITSLKEVLDLVK